MRLTTQLIAWGAEWPKHRKPQRPLRLQYLRQERQTHQWRIHRPRRGQAVDGGAGEESRIRAAQIICSPSLQDGPLCPAECPNLMIRGRLPNRSRAHGTAGSLSHAFSTALSTSKKRGIPCLVDKVVDNVDNFPGPAVDKWGPEGGKGKSHETGLFGSGPAGALTGDMA